MDTPGWSLILSRFLHEHQSANFRGDERAPSSWSLPKEKEDFDFLFDAHIEVDPALSPVANTLRIVEQLRKLFPQRFSGISEEAVSGAVEDVLAAEQIEHTPQSPRTRSGSLGIHFQPDAVKLMADLLDSTPGLKSLSEYQNHTPLEKAGGPHVTVLFMGSKKDSDLTGLQLPLFVFVSPRIPQLYSIITAQTERELSVKEKIERDPIAEIPVTVTSVAQNDKVTALVVDIPEEYQAEKKIYHITLATLDKSVPPVYSNTLLKSLIKKDNKEGGVLVALKEPLVLTGVVRAMW